MSVEHTAPRGCVISKMALRSLLTGIEKVSAGDVVGAEMAEDIRELVPECFASIGAAMAELLVSLTTRSRKRILNGTRIAI